MPQSALPLEDIILPPAISWWPLAWGWWALLLATIALVAAALWILVRTIKRRQQQQLSLQNLHELCGQQQGSALYAALNSWLKIQLKAQQPQALALHGQAWADFLQHSTAKACFSPALLEALSQGVYRPVATEVSLEECLNSAEQWQKAKKVLVNQGGQDV